MLDIRSGRCPICDHRVIIEAIPAEFGHGSAEAVSAVTYDPRWFLEGRNIGHPHGRLKLYVCRGCGYCQYFADDPSTIPIGEGHKTRLIESPPANDPCR